MIKPWHVGSFVGSVVIGGAAFVYIPDNQVETLDVVPKTEVLRGRKVFLKRNEFLQLQPHETNDLIILGENYIEGRYETLYFTNKNDFNEWRESNAEIRKNHRAN